MIAAKFGNRARVNNDDIFPRVAQPLQLFSQNDRRVLFVAHGKRKIDARRIECRKGSLCSRRPGGNAAVEREDIRPSCLPQSFGKQGSGAITSVGKNGAHNGARDEAADLAFQNRGRQIGSEER